jgi:hypothetical protein
MNNDLWCLKTDFGETVRYFDTYKRAIKYVKKYNINRYVIYRNDKKKG